MPESLTRQPSRPLGCRCTPRHPPTRRSRQLSLRRWPEQRSKRSSSAAARCARAARDRADKMTAVPRRLLEARRRQQVATAQREVLSHRRLRRTTCLTNWLARQPMQFGRLARVERVRLATRYVPTCGGLAARPRPSELPRAARSNPNPDVPSSSGRPLSLPSPTLPPPLLPSPPPPSLPQSELRWPSPPPRCHWHCCSYHRRPVASCHTSRVRARARARGPRRGPRASPRARRARARRFLSRSAYLDRYR